ncbi:hypothetical protein BC829DRAFT_421913 [Chytridium lagenaria]|nr:hypothetical protein BC829DRAFT_421913 [Chytridium lagenaria]
MLILNVLIALVVSSANLSLAACIKKPTASTATVISTAAGTNDGYYAAPSIITTTSKTAVGGSYGSPVVTAIPTTTTSFVPPVVSTTPAIPKGLGTEEVVPFPDPSKVIPFVDNFYTNQRNNPCWINMETNAGVRVTKPILDFWMPSSLKMDAGINLPAANGCPAVNPSNWSGIPMDPTDGKPVLEAIHKHNIDYCINATQARKPEQVSNVYFEDRRSKGYNLINGLGPLASVWFTVSKFRVDDNGNGWGDRTNPEFNTIATFLDPTAGPPKFQSLMLSVPSLATSQAPTGIVSGHTAEAYRKSLALAYVLPERYQQMVARAAESGENVFSLVSIHLSTSCRAARDLTRKLLLNSLGSNDTTYLAKLAVSGTSENDKFADLAATWETLKFRTNYGFPIIGKLNQPAVVPKGSEVLLETRFPYLSGDQLRTILKSTALPSGHPINDDEEGWGRLNLFVAAAGPTQLNGDLDFTQNADLGDFSAVDIWKNDITGAGKLVKRGSGLLQLKGVNTFTGGLVVLGGTVEASAKSIGAGDVYVGGSLILSSSGVIVKGNLATLKGSKIAVKAATIKVEGDLVIEGGELIVDLEGFKKGDLINLFEAKSIAGGFQSIKGGKLVLHSQRRQPYRRLKLLSSFPFLNIFEFFFHS